MFSCETIPTITVAFSFSDLCWFTNSIHSKFWLAAPTLSIAARVEVLEIKSADQLWFRHYPFVIQRCSLSENFCTALIHLWTALITRNWKSQNQRGRTLNYRWFSLIKSWFMAEQRWSLKQLWNSTLKKLKANRIRADSAVILFWNKAELR